jgi:hypothetical protein
MARMTERVMLSGPVKTRLTLLAVELGEMKGTDLTYSDTVEELLNDLTGTSWLMKAWREAKL